MKTRHLQQQLSHLIILQEQANVKQDQFSQGFAHSAVMILGELEKQTALLTQLVSAGGQQEEIDALRTRLHQANNQLEQRIAQYTPTSKKEGDK